MPRPPGWADDEDVTDSSGVLRDWRVVLAGGLAVLVGSVVTLVVRTGDPATADSYLSGVRAAALVLGDGTLVTAHDGMRVPDGVTVRTGAGGGAVIGTAGRSVYLGSLTTVRVTDGVRQDLQRGQVMVDARNGPRLGLTTRAGLANIADGALVRLETGPVLRLGVFEGSTSLTASGRLSTRDVPELFQLQAPYVALPGAPTALALTDDAWEQRLAPDLVNADRDLNALASGLSGASGQSVLEAAPVSLRRASLVSPTATVLGEQALSVAIAQTSRRAGPLEETLAFVQRARDEGGSWGVVAALAKARVTAVSALLDTVLAPPGTTPPPVLAGGPQEPLFPGLLTPSPSTSDQGGPSHGPTHQPSSPPRTKSPTPRPTTPNPTETADDLISTITGLLSPTPSSLLPRLTGH
jgi:hypothetical protein